MANPITYADLDELLSGHGFVREVLADQHVAYLDRTDEPIFVFPTLPLHHSVEPMHLAAVRRWLLETGRCDEDDFDRWLWQIRFGDQRPARAEAIGAGRATGVG